MINEHNLYDTFVSGVDRMLFEEYELQTLAALMDTLILPDEYPGGWAGAGNYLLNQLASTLKDEIPLYKESLKALNMVSNSEYQMEFYELNEQQRTRIVEDLERDVLSCPIPGSPKIWISHAVRHTAEGYYSNPENGGNPEVLSWKMIGFVVTA